MLDYLAAKCDRIDGDQSACDAIVDGLTLSSCDDIEAAEAALKLLMQPACLAKCQVLNEVYNKGEDCDAKCGVTE